MSDETRALILDQFRHMHRAIDLMSNGMQQVTLRMASIEQHMVGQSESERQRDKRLLALEARVDRLEQTIEPGGARADHGSRHPPD